MKMSDAPDTRSAEQQLLERAGRILALREHSRAELRTKLAHPAKGEAPPEALVEAALDRLSELGLLDDGRYALMAAEQLARKGMSAAGIRRALLARGVNTEAVEAALPAEEGDAARLEALLGRPANARKLADEHGRRSLFQALLRRGYEPDDIRQAIKNALDDGIL